MKTNPIHPTSAFRVPRSALSVERWTLSVHFLLLLLLSCATTALAAVRYVDVNSTSPSPPYTNWATAARVIQDAVDAAAAGDEILVTNGTYATGGRTVGTNVLVNRVAVDKPLTLRSVNGPQVTVIQGYQVPGTTNGNGAVRCVYLADGASLSGFTLTNGATRTAGDWEREQCGGGAWCASTNAALTNCILAGNSAGYGGGAYGGMLNNCTLTGNLASLAGGGASGGILNNCRLTGNSATWSGGGAGGGTLNNCTLTGNSARRIGGGANGGTLNNCILYYNGALQGPNFAGGEEEDGARPILLNYCCTTPLPPGVGNFTSEPLLADTSHLSAASPCIGAGSPAYATGTDIDGEAWGNPPSAGCDEYRAGAVTGPLSVDLVAAWTKVAVGFTVDFRALIEGRATASAWDFGDGSVLSNRPYASHTWSAPGTYPVGLRAWNDSHPEGVNATVTVEVVEAVHYVAASSTSSAWPFASWATAATTIQEAVDAATVTGALVLVSNGTYATGGRAVHGTMTNRVAVDKPLMLRSVNGPLVTVIRGYQVPGRTKGDGAIRCVYLADGASLSGFTLTNGATLSAGDWERDSSGGGVWCASTSAVLTNCILTGNSAQGYGGGAYGGMLYNCTLTGNSAGGGGGASGGILNNCTLTGNSAGDGGGASESALYNSTLTSNSAGQGGGAYESALYNSTLTSNSAGQGGGAHESALYGCAVTGNSASERGGGVCHSTLYNCTVTGNSAQSGGGGMAGTLGYFWLPCIAHSSIVYFNTAPVGGANWDEHTVLDYCCTTPLAPGKGNLSLDPQLASAAHLSAGSPCIGAGSPAHATGTDIDGEAWANPPSIGCDEYRAGAVTGPLSAALVAAWTNVAVGFTVDCRALIEGWAGASAWDFGDGVVVSNWPYASHAWKTPGDYTVVLRAYNDSHLAGVSATGTVRVFAQPVHYVALDSANPLPPYTTWATAAGNIQDAVDAATLPGALVLVSNGVYATGGRLVGTNLLLNRVAVDKPVALRSVSGPELTVIKGYQVPGSTNGDGAIRCVYLADGASLSGFALTNGATRTEWGFWPYCDVSGGGVWCVSAGAGLTNCVLTRNSAMSGGGVYGGTLYRCTLTGNSALGSGGGVYGGTLYKCTLTDNWAWVGGGASEGTLNNCTLTGNSAGGGGGASGGILNNCSVTGNSASGQGGGVYGGTLSNCTLTRNSVTNQEEYDGGGGAFGGALNNCILYDNTATRGPNHAADNYCNWWWNPTHLNHCCTTPMPTNGVGNITDAPLFIDQAGGNLRLQPSSPCINAGNNAYAAGDTDLDGNPRLVSGTVDIGAYEYQGSGSTISYAWLQQFGLPTDGSADSTDSDADGLNTWQEWRCQTDPTDARSVLRLLPLSLAGNDVQVRWPSVEGVSYFLERSTDLGASPPFTPLATNLLGVTGTNTLTDINAAALPGLFYRVGVAE